MLAFVLLSAATAATPCDGEALLRDEHWKRLRSCAEARLARDAEDGEASYWLARVKLEAGDLEAAQPLADRAAARLPRRADVRFWMAVVYGRKAERAGVFSRIGLARRFKNEAEAAASLDPAYIDARIGLIDFHLKAPSLVGGDKKQAEALAAEIARLDACRGWLVRARMARKQNQKEALEELHRKAVDANPRQYDALVQLASYYLLDSTRREAAEDPALRALKLEPGRGAAYRFLAALYALQGRWSDLDAVLAQVDEKVPDDRYSYFAAASALVREEKELARAERYLRRYLEQGPDIAVGRRAAAHFRLGQALSKLGRTDDAIRELETVVTLDPGSREAKAELKRLKKG